jgi:alpha-L-fucosidase 2
MLRKIVAPLLVSLASLLAHSGLPAAENLQNDMTLWYKQPANAWLDAMPLGNGYIGAMVFGRSNNERIALNESSFWSGRPHDYDDPDAGKYYNTIKELVFARKFKEAENLINEHFYGKPAAQQAYQPLGNLDFVFPVDPVFVTDYRRELNMETGIAAVKYKVRDVEHTREVFVSYPDRVLVMKISANKPGQVSFDVNLTSPPRSDFPAKIAYGVRSKANESATGGDTALISQWKGPLPEENWLIAPVEGLGLKYQVNLNLDAQGGEVKTHREGLRVQGADSVVLILTAATSYVKYNDITADPSKRCAEILGKIAGKDYDTLRSRHIADFNGLMGRVHVKVGDPKMNETPTDERLTALRAGQEDPNLEALVFQFGRYALASSSRKGGQPANLQAIWNEALIPNWGSKYTININTQMNYWLAEVCNLSETHEPLFSMIKDISETGAKTAKVYYGGKGWVTHHNIDLWRGTAPVDAARYGMWPVGGAWLCLHLGEHYAYTGDKEFLKEYYPVMKGSAEFLMSILVEHPQLGYLVTPFSMSPEHGFLDDNGVESFVSPAPTMDGAIMRELFGYCIEFSKILDVDEDFRKRLETVLTKLPPYKVSKQGFIQEWLEDFTPAPAGHSFSTHFVFFPGKSILLRQEHHPELVQAVKTWMDSRRGRGGFPTCWDICMWARLERGDKTAENMRSYISNSLANNLHNRGSNQSDATFGFTAGVAESLLQSHAGEISLLPALPKSWGASGEVSGLKARGGYEVSMQWRDGKLVSAEIVHPKGGETVVRFGGDHTVKVSVEPEKVLTVKP